MVLGVGGVAALGAQVVERASFELTTKRMDVDVDGSPTAYGPVGMKTLDYLSNAHQMGKARAPIVGYVLDEHGKPVVQGPSDPAPGYYVSQTAYSDEAIEDERNPRAYLDATKINYVVLGNAAKKRGARLGDFAAVWSMKTGKAAYAIVGDDGNPSGDEGSLHLLQELGYPFHDGKDEAVEHGEIVIRFYPKSNEGKMFFHTQAELDDAAKKVGVSLEFAKPGSGGVHPRKS
jgi:Fungal chitosanase of glycosyl hydrolase group 75